MNEIVEAGGRISQFARLAMDPSVGQGKQAGNASHRANARAAGLWLMFIAACVATLGGASARAANTLYDIQFNPDSACPQTGAAIIGQSGDYWNRLGASGGHAR